MSPLGGLGNEHLGLPDERRALRRRARLPHLPGLLRSRRSSSVATLGQSRRTCGDRPHPVLNPYPRRFAPQARTARRRPGSGCRGPPRASRGRPQHRRRWPGDSRFRSQFSAVTTPRISRLLETMAQQIGQKLGKAVISAPSCASSSSAPGSRFLADDYGEPLLRLLCAAGDLSHRPRCWAYSSSLSPPALKRQAYVHSLPLKKSWYMGGRPGSLLDFCSAKSLPFGSMLTGAVTPAEPAASLRNVPECPRSRTLARVRAPEPLPGR